MKRLIPIFVMVLCVVLTACSKEDKGKSSVPGKLSEGAVVPDFTVKGPDGNDISLSSMKGKVVMLNFWATWCAPCREEIPSMMTLNQKMADKPFQMMAVSIDDGGNDSCQEFFKRTGFKLPYYLDQEQRVSSTFGVTGVPETFIIDKQGVLVKKVIGGMDWASADAVKFFSDLAAK